MITVALEERAAIDLFFSNYEHDPSDRELHILDDLLTEDDWLLLSKMNETLTILKETSMCLESSFATLYNCIPEMDSILDHLESRRLNESDPIMMPMYQQAWEKMVKYYKLLEDSPANIAASVLHPGYKWDYIDTRWHNDWLDPAKASMKEFWQSKYMPEQSSQSYNTSPCSFRTATSTNQFKRYQDQQKQRAFEKAMEYQAEGDDYERYCAAPIEWPENDDPITWWLQEKQRLEYPSLYKMAINILSIPAMSADVERLFSSAGLTLSNRRNRMSTDMLEALESLKSWLRIKDFDWKLESEDDGS